MNRRSFIVPFAVFLAAACSAPTGTPQRQLRHRNLQQWADTVVEQLVLDIEQLPQIKSHPTKLKVELARFVNNSTRADEELAMFQRRIAARISSSSLRGSLTVLQNASRARSENDYLRGDAPAPQREVDLVGGDAPAPRARDTDVARYDANDVLVLTGNFTQLNESSGVNYELYVVLTHQGSRSEWKSWQFTAEF
ncbi:MAG: hypothetical protein R3F29_06170 [Planctomycetota bacterium]